MTEKILFVFEGDKTEKTITDSLLKHFITNSDRIVISSYKTDIYSLYKEISADDDLDAFAVVIDKNKDLKDFSRDSFSQMFLFFDHDAHSRAASNEKITELLNYFNEETDKGKLFISYPMVESLKCINELGNTEEFCLHSYEIAKGADFKPFIPTYAHKSLIHFNLYDKARWNDVIKLHCIKANYLTSGNMTFPTLNIEQLSIFNNQKEKLINTIGHVATLSSFPMMLLHFLGATSLFREVSGEVIRDEVY